MADVFVSYARSDRPRVQSLAAALERVGWTVWWDREILAGTEFEQVIQTELDAARCVLVAWSSTSVASAWVRNEANEGLKRRILLPVLLDGSTPPLAFRHIQTITFDQIDQGSDSLAFQDLCRALTKLVGPPPREAAPPPVHPASPPAVSRPAESGVSGPVASRPAGRRASLLVACLATLLLAGGIGAYFMLFRGGHEPARATTAANPPPNIQSTVGETVVPPGDGRRSGGPTSLPPRGNPPTRGGTQSTPGNQGRPGQGSQGSPKDPVPIPASPAPDPAPPAPDPPAPEEPAPARRSIKELIMAGEAFEVEFDALPMNTGTIQPRGRYSVAFLPGENSWRVSGPRHPDGVLQNNVVMSAADECAPSRSAICVWGAPFRFDDQDQVFYNVGTRRVGRIHRNE